MPVILAEENCAGEVLGIRVVQPFYRGDQIIAFGFKQKKLVKRQSKQPAILNKPVMWIQIGSHPDFFARSDLDPE